jgi:hypothetical protein
MWRSQQAEDGTLLATSLIFPVALDRIITAQSIRIFGILSDEARRFAHTADKSRFTGSYPTTHRAVIVQTISRILMEPERGFVKHRGSCFKSERSLI